MSGRRTTLKREDDREEASPGEKAFMVLSAAFTLALFGYLAYQGWTAGASSTPEVSVVGTQTLPEGDVLVVVRLDNRGGAGLLEAEVEVKCGDDPPTLAFRNVPAESMREASVLCPPGTQDPEASLVWFVQA